MPLGLTCGHKFCTDCILHTVGALRAALPSIYMQMQMQDAELVSPVTSGAMVCNVATCHNI